ncbi:RWD domain-containing protein 2A isoform X2 [Lagopus leucura]|uniref:RWD domain-containing protein 2A isoform X2 n=1 Tax=Lagopus leucura TaxID=30410 RepID=UPI001C67FE4F|nr:RWD domain-containing protein 2A isoform X2 [Lagopus leucura]
MAAAVRECLELQLLEVEMLLSMFPKKGEISLDEAAVPALQRYLRDGGGSLPPRLEYSVAVGVGEPEVKVELQVQLPHMYPHVAPQLFARSNALHRQQQLQLNTLLTSHISSLDSGKPGVICVEGTRENCEEFWRVIRYPNWKHISCKHVETVEAEGSIDNLRLFQTFEDLQFQAHGDYGLRNDYHMDLGQFLEFLKQHQSGHIFQILFGVEGKLADK